MKIALLMGRGVEGCGVTRYTVEQYNYMASSGHDVKVFSTKDKNWGRKKSHELVVEEIRNDELLSLKQRLIDYDVVFIHSVPSTGHSDECQKNFLEVVRSIDCFKVFIQNDHLKASMNRNAYMWETVEECDLVYSHSLENYFSETFSTRYNNPLAQLMNPTDIELRQFNGLGMDFKLLEKYKKKFHEKKRRFTYIGRFARFKHPERVIELQKYLSERAIITELRGIEKSIGAKYLIYDNPIVVEGEKYDNPDDLSVVHVYGPYKRSEALEELSTSMFGCNFFELEPEYYGGHMEYASVEPIAVGTVPVFSEHWGENVVHPEIGERFIDIEKTGVYIGPENYEESVELMFEISNDEVLYNEYVDTSTEVFSIFDERCIERVVSTVEDKISLDK